MTDPVRHPIDSRLRGNDGEGRGSASGQVR